MTKYWKTQMEDGGTQLALFVATSDEAVKFDKEGRSNESAIHFRRMHAPRLMDSWEGDHADLAAGLFSLHRDARGYQQKDIQVSETDSIPQGIQGIAIGGHSVDGRHQFLTLIYEQRFTE